MTKIFRYNSGIMLSELVQIMPALISLPGGLNKGKYLEKDSFAESLPLGLGLFTEHIEILITNQDQPSSIVSII